MNVTSRTVVEGSSKICALTADRVRIEYEWLNETTDGRVEETIVIGRYDSFESKLLHMCVAGCRVNEEKEFTFHSDSFKSNQLNLKLIDIEQQDDGVDTTERIMSMINEAEQLKIGGDRAYNKKDCRFALAAYRRAYFIANFIDLKINLNNNTNTINNEETGDDEEMEVGLLTTNIQLGITDEFIVPKMIMKLMNNILIIIFKLHFDSLPSMINDALNHWMEKREFDKINQFQKDNKDLISKSYELNGLLLKLFNINYVIKDIGADPKHLITIDNRANQHLLEFIMIERSSIVILLKALIRQTYFALISFDIEVAFTYLKKIMELKNDHGISLQSSITQYLKLLQETYIEHIRKKQEESKRSLAIG
ncbi:hypothetical protein SNEBB_007992 [Seison nebaliae]|nr:hypothetical protein SNEBB_007992 [Seison nebaliae]